MSDKRAALIKALNNPETCARAWRTGVGELIRLTGKSKNACAATVSALMQEAGILEKGKFYHMTSQVEAFLKSIGCVKITDPRDLIEGDICFSVDGNNNKISDHVFTYKGPRGKAPKYDSLVFDNYEDELHLRNLGPGGRGKFWYAYRLPGGPVKSKDEAKAAEDKRQRFFDHIADMYDTLNLLDLPDTEEKAILEALNNIRWSETLKKYKRG